jgi:hypothetical protein
VSRKFIIILSRCFIVAATVCPRPFKIKKKERKRYSSESAIFRILPRCFLIALTLCTGSFMYKKNKITDSSILDFGRGFFPLEVWFFYRPLSRSKENKNLIPVRG